MNTQTAKFQTAPVMELHKPAGFANEIEVFKKGALNDPSRDVKETAKLIRADIKKAIKAGALPAIKTSVKIDRFSMGQAINVIVTESPVELMNLEGMEKLKASNYRLSLLDVGGRHTEAGSKVLEVLQAIGAQYNVSRHHAQSDYYETDFYFHTQIETAPES